MEKQDYIQIARAIAAGKNCLGVVSSDTFIKGFQTGVNNVAQQIVESLARTDKGFDREEFYRQCGFSREA